MAKTIALINNLYGEYARGGAERVVESLVKQYQTEGYRVIVISLGRTAKVVQENDVTVYYYKAPQLFSYLDLDKRLFPCKLMWHLVDVINIFSARGIMKILKKEKVDIVHTHNMMGLGLPLMKCIQKNNIEHLYTIHDVQLVEPSGVLAWDHIKDTVFQKAYTMMTRCMVGNPDTVFYPSQYMADFYTARGFFKKSKIDIQSQALVRTTALKKEKGKVFIFVGGLTKHKGAHLLEEMFSGIENKELCIVGNGPLYRRLSDWAKKDSNVHVYGGLTHTEVLSLYAQADTLIFTSTCIENRPKVLEEAVNAGLHIIAANTGGVEEMIGGLDGVTLVNPGDITAFRQAIEE
ncbi:glycosyltransferase [Patescibacteria group bacterium]|nr:glycosyltransferase [Patescibacteria group bacterium]MBU1721419.1 glycosyltransferase [Patescibacteria group bacterium]MBU1901859.1 glycosyltransferase [Patescibacteria group bacterium]